MSCKLIFFNQTWWSPMLFKASIVAFAAAATYVGVQRAAVIRKYRRDSQTGDGKSIIFLATVNLSLDNLRQAFDVWFCWLRLVSFGNLIIVSILRILNINWSTLVVDFFKRLCVRKLRKFFSTTTGSLHFCLQESILTLSVRTIIWIISRAFHINQLSVRTIIWIISRAFHINQNLRSYTIAAGKPFIILNNEDVLSDILIRNANKCVLCKVQTAWIKCV